MGLKLGRNVISNNTRNCGMWFNPKLVVERYQGKVSRIYFRADAGFANPEVYEF